MPPNTRRPPPTGGGGGRQSEPGSAGGADASTVPHRPDVPAPLRKRAVLDAMAEAEAAVVARRAVVLAHPDLAARLERHPFAIRRPDQWNGYIPPSWYPGPIRAQLVGIAAEARRRETAG